jgi:hypothetical protein
MASHSHKRERQERSRRQAVNHAANADGDDEPLKGSNGAVTVGDYRRMKARFEVDHAWNRSSDSLIVRDPSTGGVTLMNVEHSKRALSSEWSFSIGDSPDDNIPFFPKWMQDPERRTVKSIVNHDRGRSDEFFVPFRFAYEQFIQEQLHQAEMENVSTDVLQERFAELGLEYSELQMLDEDDNVRTEYNVMASAEMTKIVLDLFKTLVEMAAGESSSDTYNYFLDYLAHMIQKPLVNPGVAIVLTGGKGVGKDSLCNFIANYVIGKAFSYCYTSTSQFFEKHDTNFMGKIMVKLEEAEPSLMKTCAGVLRARITSEQSMANPKGQQSYQMPNYTRYFFTSNAPDPTGLNVDGRERRYLLLPFSDKLADTCAPGFCGTLDNDSCKFREFWQPFNKYVMTPLGGFIVSMFLRERDISSRVIFKLPHNPYLSVIAANDQTPEELFVEDWRNDAIEEVARGGDNPEISSKILYERFKSWMAINQPEVRVMTSHTFYQKLAKQVRDKKINLVVKGGRKAFYSVS